MTSTPPPPQSPDPQYSQAAPVAPQVPAKKKSKGKLIGIGCGGCAGLFLILIIIIALAGALGGSNDADPASSSAPATQEEATEAETPTEDEAPAGDSPAEEEGPAEEEPAAAGVGTPVTVDDAQLTVTNVEDNVEKVGVSGLEETPQGKFVRIHIEVANTGNEELDVFSDNFKLIGAEGQEYSISDASFWDENAIVFEGVNPGNTLSGTIVFDIPADATAVKLTYTPGLFGTKVAEVSLS